MPNCVELTAAKAREKSDRDSRSPGPEAIPSRRNVMILSIDVGHVWRQPGVRCRLSPLAYPINRRV